MTSAALHTRASVFGLLVIVCSTMFVPFFEASASAAVIRVHASGKAHTDGNGNDWPTDHEYDTGVVASLVKANIVGTDDDRLYQTKRYYRKRPRDLSHKFRVPIGNCSFASYLTEQARKTRGKGAQVFDVLIEGNRLLKHFDLLAAVGTSRAVFKRPRFDVNNRQANTKFCVKRGCPIISTLEIIEQSTQSDPTNNFPVAHPDKAVTGQNISIDIPVLANDEGLNGASLKLSISQLPMHGKTTINGNKTVTYAPIPNFQGEDTFSSTITEADGGFSDSYVIVQTVASEKKLKASWQPHPGTVDGYYVYFGRTPAFSYGLLSDLPLSKGLYSAQAPSIVYKAQDSGVQKGDQACFRVRVYRDSDTSDFSKPNCAGIK